MYDRETENMNSEGDERVYRSLWKRERDRERQRERKRIWVFERDRVFSVYDRERENMNSEGDERDHCGRERETERDREREREYGYLREIEYLVCMIERERI